MDAAINDYRARREKRLADRGIYPEKISKIIAFAQRRAARLDARGYRADAEGDDQKDNQNEGGGSSGGGHGNTRLPFGLCKRFGIEIDPSWGPKEAWDALAGKGITPAGAYERLKKGEDPGTPDTPEPPKEPVRKIVSPEYGGAEYGAIRSRMVSMRGYEPWRLYGVKVEGTGDGSYAPSRLSEMFWTKTDMFRYLKERGVEEFIDPETGEVVNPKEMELPTPVLTSGVTGYKAVSIGMRDGRYTIYGTDMDGKKKAIKEYGSLAGAKKFLEEYGVKEGDIKLSPALKKREKERVEWLSSDKKLYFEDGGVKYGDPTIEEQYLGGWYLKGEAEDGGKVSKKFSTKADLMKYLKDQGVERVKFGKEAINPQEYEIPKTKATIGGMAYQDVELSVSPYGDVSLVGVDLDGKRRPIDSKGYRETLGAFRERISKDYGLGDDRLTISDESRQKMAEIEKTEEEKERKRKEFEAKAIPWGRTGSKYADIEVVKDPFYGEYSFFGYDKYGERKRISHGGDMYDLKRYAELSGYKVEDFIKDEKIREEYNKFEETMREFDAKALDFAGDKYADVQIVYEGHMYKVRGINPRGQLKEVARESSYEDLEEAMNQYGYSPTQFPMDDEATRRKEKAMKAKYALATGGYYSLGKKDEAFKDIRIQQDASNEWYIIGKDVDGEEKQVEIAKSWDDAVSRMSKYGVSDYKLKDKSGAEMGKPTYGMHGVMLMRKPGGGFVVYADTDRFGTHEIMYETPNESEARKWLRDNNVPESGIKTRGMNPNDDVDRGTPTTTLKNFDTHRMKAIEGTFIEDMSEEDKRDAADMMAELFKQGEYRVARSTDSFAGILENGYKSQIEMGKGGYGASKDKEGRKKCSDKMYGHGGLDKTEYEKMGYIAPPDIAEDYNSGDHPFYGGSSPMTYTLKKDNLKNRTTYTFGDSLNTYGSGYGDLKSAGYAGEKPTIEGLTGIGGRNYMDRALRAYREYKNGDISFSDMFRKLRKMANNNYIELQFTGPVTASDIKKVSFDNVQYIKNAFSSMTPEQRKKTIKTLRDNGIEVEYRKDRYSPFVDGWDWIKKNYPDDVA